MKEETTTYNELAQKVAHLEQQLQQQQQLKSFFDVSSDLIVIANFDGYFLQFGPCSQWLYNVPAFCRSQVSVH